MASLVTVPTMLHPRRAHLMNVERVKVTTGPSLSNKAAEPEVSDSALAP